MPHPDLLLAHLSARQRREIEIYAGIEPIGWDVGVSRPLEGNERRETSDDGRTPAAVEDKLDGILGRFGTANER